MADFDLIQTDAQVQSILNDGQNMQGAGAQTTLTTESVLLKDVNGNYHKILKSSFTEAIRDTLAGLLVNNDKGTTINQIAAIANSDFGSITPANLASVLGGVMRRDGTWTGSFDDYTEQGVYDIFTGNDLFFLVVFSGARYTIQIRVSYSASDPSFKFRKRYGNDWSNWVSIG